MGVRSRQSRLSSCFTAGLLLASALPAVAQPRLGGYAQKLAPFVPSPQRVIDRMLEMAALKQGETLFDLGCGDGRVLITAAQRYNAKAVGVEVDDRLVTRANQFISEANLKDRVRVVKGDLMEADLTGADVVVLYLLTGSNELLRPRLEKMLKPGARVISYSYRIPGWKPLKVDRTGEQHGHEIFLYEMPPTKQ